MLIRGEALFAQAAGAVTIDQVTGAAVASAADPWGAVAHTLGALADYILLMVSAENTADTAIAGVTVGGISMNAGALAQLAGSRGVQLFWLDNSGSFPSTGSVDVIVDWDGATIAGYIGIYSLIGAHSGAPNRTNVVTNASSGSGAPSLASVPAGAAIISGVNGNATGTWTVSGSDGDAVDYTNGTASGAQNGAFAHSLPGSSMTVTHSWTGGLNRIAALMAEILPA